MQEIVVFEFKILNEQIKPEAMEVIWEYSGTPTKIYVIILSKPNK